MSTILRRKARALDAARDSVAVLRGHASDRQRALFDALGAARTQLAGFRADSHPIDTSAVQRAIPPGAVLVEYAVYRPSPSTTLSPAPPRLVAYVFAAGAVAGGSARSAS